MDNLVLKIADKVEGIPGGRLKKNGSHSGEEFYDTWLLPMFEAASVSGKTLVIDMDGCLGYPSSFLDESFGKLGRMYGGGKAFEKMTFISEDQPGLVAEIRDMMVMR